MGEWDYSVTFVYHKNTGIITNQFKILRFWKIKKI